MSDDKNILTMRIACQSDEIYKYIKELPNRSEYVRELAKLDIDKRLARLSINDDILEKFRNDPENAYLIDRLLNNYYNNNIIFVNEMRKMQSIGDLNKIDIISDNKNEDIADDKVNINSVTKLSVIEDEVVSTKIEENETTLPINENVNIKIPKIKEDKKEDTEVVHVDNKEDKNEVLDIDNKSDYTELVHVLNLEEEVNLEDLGKNDDEITEEDEALWG